ncbi:hypothetical protein D7U74_14165 [Stenotrophomonas maltophilia]|nr:hypothetical protein [Stenotrophomonas maltophilia]
MPDKQWTQPSCLAHKLTDILILRVLNFVIEWSRPFKELKTQGSVQLKQIGMDQSIAISNRSTVRMLDLDEQLISRQRGIVLIVKMVSGDDDRTKVC